MSEERGQGAAGAAPDEESKEQQARTDEALRRVFDEALRAAIPGPEAEGGGGEEGAETPGP